MERKSYRFIWWLLVLVILAGIIWYVVIHNREKEYVDGTLVLQYQEEDRASQILSDREEWIHG